MNAPSSITECIRASLLANGNVEHFNEHHFLLLHPESASTSLFEPLLDDMKFCFENVAKVPNQVEFLLPGGPVRLTKPDVFECDLHNDLHRSQLPQFSEFLANDVGPLADMLKTTLPHSDDLCAVQGIEGAKAHTTVKLQMNTGGSFPWHYDNPGKPNQRRLTLAVYLTKGWDVQNSGELLIQPFLGPQHAIPPTFVSIVLFRSDTILHAVRPFVPTASCSARYCFTVWFDGCMTNTDDDVHLRAKHLTLSALPVLRSTPLQRVLSRAVYDDEYRERLAECFGGMGCKDAQISVALHEAHLKPLMANKAVASFVEELRHEKGVRGDRVRLR